MRGPRAGGSAGGRRWIAGTGLQRRPARGATPGGREEPRVTGLQLVVGPDGDGGGFHHVMKAADVFASTGQKLLGVFASGLIFTATCGTHGHKFTKLYNTTHHTCNMTDYFCKDIFVIYHHSLVFPPKPTTTVFLEQREYFA